MNIIRIFAVIAVAPMLGGCFGVLPPQQGVGGCTPAPRILGQGPQGGSPCWGGQQGQLTVVIPSQQQPVQLAEVKNCENGTAGGAIVGGGIGAFAKNHTPLAILGGAAIGAIVGHEMCRNAQGQIVYVQNTQQSQRKMLTPAYCEIAGTCNGIPFSKTIPMPEDSPTLCNQVISALKSGKLKCETL